MSRTSCGNKGPGYECWSHRKEAQAIREKRGFEIPDICWSEDGSLEMQADALVGEA